ncbi:MAG TPA: electron transport complex subunit RsxC [Gammaproteobacteria bacterium]|nr:electron transport complex subunit RsxC [Gammaproteobacteria bacterium]
MLEITLARRLVGGLELAAHKTASTSQPIERCPLPPELVISLHQHGGHSAVPVVDVGRRVLKGEPIGKPGPAPSAAVHASSSGRIAAIEERLVPAGNCLRRSLCIVLETDGEDRPYRAERADPWPAERAAQLERIARGGLAGLGGAVFPTSAKLASANSCRMLIVNGAECEPYISCDDMLMRAAPEQVVSGARRLADLTGAAECLIAIERDKPQAFQAVAAAARDAADARLKLVRVPSVYPAGGERQLVELLSGEEVPSGQVPSDVGFVCQNVGTAAALHRLAEDGEPLISRIVTVTGGGVAVPRNLEVPIGVAVGRLIEHCGGYAQGVARLIHGGSMMGFALPNDTLPVTKATSCVIAAGASEVRQGGESWPCIRCGDCASACPVRLQPQQILGAAHGADFDALGALGLDDCIECGCCDVVCPSHIALTEQFRRAKHALGKHRQRRALSESADERFRRKERRREEEAERGRAAQEALRHDVDAGEAARQAAVHAAVERAKRRREESQH